MVGEYKHDSLRGIIPRTFEYLFNQIKLIENNEASITFIINIAFIQIYLESIQDLFEPKNLVKIRENKDTGVYLENCQWIRVKNIDECREAFKIGEKNRVTEFTNMNAQSSRSHAILIISIEKYFIEGKNKQHLMTRSLLHLVDLAGSERVNKSGIKEIRLKEAKKINYSLLVLGNCINSLISNSFVPYRDSKLTRILQESLGGNSKTSLIVTISPSNYNADESLSSLNFGNRAMKVKNIPKINQAEDYELICIKLQEEYDKLMEKYTELEIEYEKVYEENEKWRNGEIVLDLERKSIRNQIDGIGNNQENSFNVDKFKKEYENLLKELEEKYKIYIKHLKEENNRIMKQVDMSLINKEEKIEILNEELIELKNANKNLIENNEELKKQFDNILIEKDELNNKIILLNNINKENNYILSQKTKELLSKQNIYTDVINNQNIEKILIMLINDIEKKSNENNTYKQQINILNNYLDETKKNFEEKINIIEFENNNINKNYEEKIKQIEMENYKIKEEINNYIEQINRKNNENEEIKNSLIDYRKLVSNIKNEKKNLENKIISLNENIKKLNALNNELTNKNKITENEYLEIKNKLEDIQKKKEVKTVEINAYLNHSELKRVTNTININEKLLNKSINLILNHMNIFNLMKKEFKKMEIIIENDIPSMTSNSYEHTLNKAKIQINKIENIIENIKNINFNNNTLLYKNYDIKDNINKLNELISENENYFINNFLLTNKLFKRIIDLHTKNKMVNYYKEKNSLSLNDKSEEAYKYNLIETIIKNIDKFQPICFNSDNSDLKEELYILKNKLNQLNTLEVVKSIIDILEKIVLRSVEFRNQKEMEIQNLNNKIIYLLREIENYKKYFVGSGNEKKLDEEKRLLNNQLFLKDGEIIRLNKENDLYLKKIIKLNNEINRNKDKKDIDVKIENDNNELLSLTEEELENTQMECQNNINKIKEELKILENQKNKENI